MVLRVGWRLRGACLEVVLNVRSWVRVLGLGRKVGVSLSDDDLEILLNLFGLVIKNISNFFAYHGSRWSSNNDS